MDCLFCKLAAKEIPSKIIYEDADTFAFLDVHPRSPGHTVVIPKNHVSTLVELPDGDVAGLFQAIKTLTFSCHRNSIRTA
jgi:histidine triad (HIT) family protein